MGFAARVILVPSIRDASSHAFVFPQPAFGIDTADLKNQITCLPNPGFFTANKVKVGCCTVAILKQLSGEEISKTPADALSKDCMGRLATHLLSQRSFYPLYPPSEDVPLDLSLATEALQIPSIPHILVLPSTLAPFLKVLSLGEKSSDEEENRCIAVNPGRLARGLEGAPLWSLTIKRTLTKQMTQLSARFGSREYKFQTYCIVWQEESVHLLCIQLERNQFIHCAFK